MAAALDGQGPVAVPPPAIREDLPLARELAARLPQGRWERAIPVTDLIDLRRAYFRHLKGPAPVEPVRRAKMEAGRALHRSIDLALEKEGTFEVRLRRGGVSARIDLLSDVPVEIKTGEQPPPDDLVETRPEYVEQVAMYCALIERSEGRLVYVHHPGETNPVVVAVDVAFDETRALRAELDRRATDLRTALGLRTPAALPRCRWFDRGCEYRAASLCDCRGDELEAPGGFADRVVGQVVRGDVKERWERALEARSPSVRAPPVRRYRDLVYPRRAYFETVAPVEPANVPRTAVGDRPPSDVYDGAVGALEGGAVGDVHRLPETGPTPEEEVAGWRGEPYIVRTSRAWSRVREAEAFARFPQYALELGFRCATTGTRRGRVLLAYERATVPEDRLQVLEYTFGDGVEAYAREYRRRWALFEQALLDAGAGRLPPCAGWMTADCPYRDRCGCAEDASRSQR